MPLIYLTLCHMLHVLLPQRWNPDTNSITSVSAVNMRYNRWACKRVHMLLWMSITTHPHIAHTTSLRACRDITAYGPSLPLPYATVLPAPAANTLTRWCPCTMHPTHHKQRAFLLAPPASRALLPPPALPSPACTPQGGALHRLPRHTQPGDRAACTLKPHLPSPLPPSLPAHTTTRWYPSICRKNDNEVGVPQSGALQAI